MTLVEISVRCALKAGVFDKIIISSDDEVHKPYENISPLIAFDKRPESLCLDETSTVDVLRYITEEFSLCPKDLVCLLQPTSPLRLPIDILRSMGENNVTICEKTDHTPWLRHPVIQLADNHNLKFSNNEKLEGMYFNGASYWCNVEKLRTRELLFDADTHFVEMPVYRSIDIDYVDEFNEAKKRFTELCISEALS